MTPEECREWAAAERARSLANAAKHLVAVERQYPGNTKAWAAQHEGKPDVAPVLEIARKLWRSEQ